MKDECCKKKMFFFFYLTGFKALKRKRKRKRSNNGQQIYHGTFRVEMKNFSGFSCHKTTAAAKVTRLLAEWAQAASTASVLLHSRWGGKHQRPRSHAETDSDASQLWLEGGRGVGSLASEKLWFCPWADNHGVHNWVVESGGCCKKRCVINVSIVI